MSFSYNLPVIREPKKKNCKRVVLGNLFKDTKDRLFGGSLGKDFPCKMALPEISETRKTLNEGIKNSPKPQTLYLNFLVGTLIRFENSDQHRS